MENARDWRHLFPISQNLCRNFFQIDSILQPHLLMAALEIQLDQPITANIARNLQERPF